MQGFSGKTQGYTANVGYRYRLFKSDATGLLDLCGATDPCVGTLQQAVVDGATQDQIAANKMITLEPIWPGVEFRAVASGAITAGSWVKKATGGKIAEESTPSTKTDHSIGVAVEAATADGNVIKVRAAV